MKISTNHHMGTLVKIVLTIVKNVNKKMIKLFVCRVQMGSIYKMGFVKLSVMLIGYIMVKNVLKNVQREVFKMIKDVWIVVKVAKIVISLSVNIAKRINC